MLNLVVHVVTITLGLKTEQINANGKVQDLLNVTYQLIHFQCNNILV